MYNSSYDTIREVQGKMLKITIDMFELYEKDIDKVHLINNKLKEIMIQLKQNLIKIFNKEDLQYK